MRPMLLLLWLGTSGCLLGWDPAEDTAGLVDTTPIDTDNTVGFCGDGINVPPEECDDGEANNVGGYGFCNPDCTLGPYCGDGTPDSVEECDLGTKQNTGDYGTCNPDCTLTRFCGDGVDDPEEECDLGTAANDGSYEGCNPDCSLAGFCGDGNQDPEEECDRGTNDNDAEYGDTFGCTPECTRPGRCGDGDVDSADGEECDLGSGNNTGGYGGCNSNCTLSSDCGDGTLDSPQEECDLGSANNTGGYDGCNPDCTLDSFCGDAITDGADGEACDLGTANNNAVYGDANGCTATCQEPAFCGDGTTDLLDGETCDLGAGNNTAVYGDLTGCTEECVAPGRCGDGEPDLQDGEECDNGDLENNAIYGDVGGCTAQCTVAPFCGDGEVEAVSEACDLGTANNNAVYDDPSGCTASCQLPGFCGDGNPDLLDGETCDEGTANNTAVYGDLTGCTEDCVAPSRCGDGVLDLQDGEDCDDGDLDNNATYGDVGGCTAQCTVAPFCGDGEVETASEACDDGVNDGSLGGCNPDCQAFAPADECDALLGVTCAMFEEAYVKSSNPQRSNDFGFAVALSGDTLAVGDRFEESSATGISGNDTDNEAPAAGAVWVFQRTNGTWAQQAYIKASNTTEGDLFGSSLALEGDTLVVGAPHEDSNAIGVNGLEDNDTSDDSGAVYVFQRSGEVWSQQAYIKASNPSPGDEFGTSVSLSGDTLVVGSPGEDSEAVFPSVEDGNLASQSGAAYVLLRNPDDTWTHQAIIKATNTEAGDEFGWSVAVDGDTLAVGAWREDSDANGIDGEQADNAAANAGAVYVYVRAGIGQPWEAQAYVKASDSSNLAWFGYAVALEADTLAIGAPQTRGSLFQTDAGAVYVFHRTVDTWTQEGLLRASNLGTGDLFGFAVALNGDRLLAGAPGEDSLATDIDGSNNFDAGDSGAAYLFSRTASTWTEVTRIKASNTNSGDLFGASCAIDGTLLAIGADGEDGAIAGVNGDQSNNGENSAGAVYLRRIGF